MKPNSQPTPESNIEVKELILSLDLGYTYEMSDYATSREQEAKYEKEGLAEVDRVVTALQALLTTADQAGYTRGRQDQLNEDFKILKAAVSDGTEEIAELQKEADNG